MVFASPPEFKPGTAVVILGKPEQDFAQVVEWAYFEERKGKDIREMAEVAGLIPVYLLNSTVMLCYREQLWPITTEDLKVAAGLNDLDALEEIRRNAGYEYATYHAGKREGLWA